MMRFTIRQDIFNLLPDLCVGLVCARGIHNAQDYPEIERLLDEAVAEAQVRLTGMNASEDPRVQPYRAAFHTLGMSPSRYPSSNIALLRRVAKGKGLWHVNPVVDLGNAISISYGLPLGAHIVSEDGPGLELRLSQDDDVFVPLGGSEPDTTLTPGELVYTEGTLVHTRRWTWRQSIHGAITADTSAVLFPVDGFVGTNDTQVVAACNTLAKQLQRIFGARVQVGLTSSAQPTWSEDQTHGF